MRLGAGRSTLTRLEARRALIAALENGELDEFAQGQRKDVEKRIKVARKFLEDNPDEGASLGQCGCLGVTQEMVGEFGGMYALLANSSFGCFGDGTVVPDTTTMYISSFLVNRRSGSCFALCKANILVVLFSPVEMHTHTQLLLSLRCTTTVQYSTTQLPLMLHRKMSQPF